MKPEKRLLLDDVLHTPAGGLRREATLRAGGRILRRRRAARFAARSLALLAVVVLATLALPRKPAAIARADASAPQAVPARETVEYLTDDQLLALFPGVPVGLVKTADGRKRLIFPRPGDEAKYIVQQF